MPPVERVVTPESESVLRHRAANKVKIILGEANAGNIEETIGRLTKAVHRFQEIGGEESDLEPDMQRFLDLVDRTRAKVEETKRRDGQGARGDMPGIDDDSADFGYVVNDED